MGYVFLQQKYGDFNISLVLKQVRLKMLSTMFHRFPY